MKPTDLPEGGWYPPAQLTQGDLYPRPSEEVLATIGLSFDEAGRWRERGWLSFDPAALEELEHIQCIELVFVLNIVRSGLSDAQIDDWLSELSKPYCYDPGRVAYSFALGWVQLPFSAHDSDPGSALLEFRSWIAGLTRALDLKALDEIIEQAAEARRLVRQNRVSAPKEILKTTMVTDPKLLRPLTFNTTPAHIQALLDLAPSDALARECLDQLRQAASTTVVNRFRS